MTLGIKIDALYALRQSRLDLTKKVDAIKEQETVLRQEILELLDTVGMVKATGHTATCGVTEKIEPQVTDWELAHEFIREHNRFDLLQKRLSAPAWRDLKDSGTLVPGTEAVTVRDVSLTKSTRG